MAPSPYTCLGCSQDLKNQRSLANHIKACDNYKMLLSNKKKRQKEAAAKQKQAKKSRTAEPEMSTSHELDQQFLEMDIDNEPSVSRVLVSV